MAAPMRSTDFRSIVEPILNECFDGVYDLREDEWSRVFREQEGIPRNYHEEPVLYGFGAAPQLPDGTPVSYQQGGVLFLQRYVYNVYGLAFALTKVLVEDGDHIRIGQVYAKHLAQSLIETKETLSANVLNRAFNSSYPGGDGVSLLNSAHPLVNGGTNANTPTTAADLNETSLENAVIQIAAWTDERGLLIAARPKKLIVPPALMFVATRLLETELRVGTNNNDINAIKNNGAVPEGYTVNHFLTATNAWFLTTDVPNGLKHFERTPLANSMDGDFDTGNVRYKSRERYSFGWSDPLGIYGSY